MLLPRAEPRRHALQVLRPLSGRVLSLVQWRREHTRPSAAQVLALLRPLLTAVRALQRRGVLGLVLDPQLILLAPAASQLIYAGRDKGLPVVEEIFADRAYLDDGNLVPRSQPGAMVHGAEASLAHVMRMIEESALVSINGKRIPVNPQSICVHGDNEDAVATAQTIRDGLLKAGFSFVTLPELV